MLRIRHIYSLAYILLVHLSINAQNKAWTLKACIDTGIQRNITVKQGQVVSNINEVNLDQAKDNLYPTLNLTDAPGFTFGKTQNASGEYISQNTSSNSFALTASVTL